MIPGHARHLSTFINKSMFQHISHGGGGGGGGGVGCKESSTQIDREKRREIVAPLKLIPLCRFIIDVKKLLFITDSRYL